MRISQKILSIFCVIILISGSCTAFAASAFASTFDRGAEWDEYKSDHFIIYYHLNISSAYIREFSWKCERYYNLITERLGFSRSNFWLWENRARIFIYQTRKDYLQGTSQPEWSGASVHISKKFINTFCFQEDFFDYVLPHELAHIILREFIGLNTKVPLWFDEGVACANEKNSSRKYLTQAKRIVERKTYLPLPEMEKANYRQVQSPYTFYPSAASLVIFLLERYNKEDFVQLCRELRDGNAFYPSLNKIYGIKDAEDLNQKFLAFLTGKSYEDIEDVRGFGLDW